jgi:hypothetical protein
MIIPLLLTTLLIQPPVSSASLVSGEKTPPQVLIIGGGPEKEANQVAIESNVRYVDRLLGKKTNRVHRAVFREG